MANVEEQTITITQEKYDLLCEKARRYDMIKEALSPISYISCDDRVQRKLGEYCGL